MTGDATTMMRMSVGGPGGTTAMTIVAMSIAARIGGSVTIIAGMTEGMMTAVVMMIDEVAAKAMGLHHAATMTALTMVAMVDRHRLAAATIVMTVATGVATTAVGHHLVATMTVAMMTVGHLAAHTEMTVGRRLEDPPTAMTALEDQPALLAAAQGIRGRCLLRKRMAIHRTSSFSTSLWSGRRRACAVTLGRQTQSATSYSSLAYAAHYPPRAARRPPPARGAHVLWCMRKQLPHSPAGCDLGWIVRPAACDVHFARRAPGRLRFGSRKGSGLGAPRTDASALDPITRVSAINRWHGQLLLIGGMVGCY